MLVAISSLILHSAPRLYRAELQIAHVLMKRHELSRRMSRRQRVLVHINTSQASRLWMCETHVWKKKKKKNTRRKVSHVAITII